LSDDDLLNAVNEWLADRSDPELAERVVRSWSRSNGADAISIVGQAIGWTNLARIVCGPKGDSIESVLPEPELGGGTHETFEGMYTEHDGQAAQANGKEVYVTYNLDSFDVNPPLVNPGIIQPVRAERDQGLYRHERRDAFEAGRDFTQKQLNWLAFAALVPEVMSSPHNWVYGNPFQQAIRGLISNETADLYREFASMKKRVEELERNAEEE